MVRRWIVFLHGLAFVAGFSFIFVFVIGISAGIIGRIGGEILRAREWILGISGLLIIVLGLHTVGVIRIPFLYYDTRKQRPPKQELGYAGSFLMGITFAAGWSPCIGTILGGIWGLGASTGSIVQAVLLLSFYALGLGLPFLLAALLLDQATASIHRLRKHMRKIEMGSGILLLVIGLAMVGSVLRGLNPLTGLASLFGGSDVALVLDDWLVGISAGNILTIPLAVLAGLFSFLSPCVLPLVPVYIGYLTGQAANTMSDWLAMADDGTPSTES